MCTATLIVNIQKVCRDNNNKNNDNNNNNCIQVRNCKRICLIHLLCFDSFGSVTVSLVTVSHTKYGSLNPFRSALMVFSRQRLISAAPTSLLLTLLFWEARICELYPITVSLRCLPLYELHAPMIFNPKNKNHQHYRDLLPSRS